MLYGQLASFQKEDDFCTAFLIGCWLADIQIVGQTAHILAENDLLSQNILF